MHAYKSSSLSVKILLAVQALGSGAVISAAVILTISLRPEYTLITVVALGATLALHLLLKKNAVFWIAALAFMVGWTESVSSDQVVDISALVLCFYAFLYITSTYQRQRVTFRHLLLATLSLSAFVSFVFVAIRIFSFTPVEHFSYNVYSVNQLGFSSNNAVIHSCSVALIFISMYGLYAATERLNKNNISQLVNVLYFVVIINSITLLYQLYVNNDFLLPYGYPAGHRLSGLTSYSYALSAGYEAMLILLFFLKEKSRIRSGWFVFLACSIGFGLFLSGSRQSFVYAATCFVIFFAVYLYKLIFNKKYKEAVYMVIFVVALSLFIYFIFISLPIDNNIFDRFAHLDSNEGVINYLIDSRFSQYPLIVEAGLDHSFTGLGVGMYYTEALKLSHEYRIPKDSIPVYLNTSNSSNFYLGIIVEMGILPFLSFMLFLAHIIYSNRSSLTTPKISVSFIVFLLFLLFLNFAPRLLNAESLLFIILYVGFMGSSHERGRKSSPKRESRMNMWTAAFALTGVLIVTAFHVQYVNEHSMQKQWEKIGWNLDIGRYPAEKNGKWTGQEASYSVTVGRDNAVVFHVGTTNINYSTEVEWYVNGELVRVFQPEPGRIYTFDYSEFIPENEKKIIISVRVSNPYVPSSHGDSNDSRTLGVFIHESGTSH